ncbi:tRNA-binding protein [Aureibacter tunicatorum]|uniref:tRNA-binding protein n=1 Tax=Aureibacter tunicatorum TaxID=866807 RepID=A0AAE3XJI2_9BACT|nr:tRNA-binding protein [Aureibacter tunicatorum]MDR6238881.1 tRNA-binding protein [Aureibacter tunicatorum]BDD05192.1 tRNA-binding protein [Aureibacter tunicatorum]
MQAEGLENQISWEDFTKVDMRIGTVISAEVFEEARNPSYKLMVDFGELGVKKTSAQVTKLCKTEELVGRQVIAVVNFPPKQIANIMSECLLLAGMEEGEGNALIGPDRKVKNGTRIG